MSSSSSRFYFFTFLLCSAVRSSFEVSCKDERNRDVDWYINYKLPKIHEEPEGTYLGEGRAYAYITTPGSSLWTLSTKAIDDSGSMLGNTLTNFYMKKKSLTYLFYNDAAPVGFFSSVVDDEAPTDFSDSSVDDEAPRNFYRRSVGHLKGVLAFDENSGFWMVHSIPKFADDESFQYPHSGFVNGQSILCVTFNTLQLNDIALQLLVSYPNIYSYFITPEVKSLLDSRARTLFTENPLFIRRKPLSAKVSLRSLGNETFVSYAKDGAYKEDLYSGLIAPDSGTSLLAESWRRGRGINLPPSCESDYYVLDVVSIKVADGSRRNPEGISFKSTHDHSKWAISSDDSKVDLVCIADINRMQSQKKRGGGALCFISAPVRKAFRSIIEETDLCSTN